MNEEDYTSGSSSSDSDDKNTNKLSSKKSKADQACSSKSTDTDISTSTTSEDGKMILLKGDDSLWKNNPDKGAHNILADEKKSRENDFEDYLEDLLF